MTAIDVTALTADIHDPLVRAALAGVVAELESVDGDFWLCVSAIADWHEQYGEEWFAAGLRRMLERGYEPMARPYHSARTVAWVWFNGQLNWAKPRHESSILPEPLFKKMYEIRSAVGGGCSTETPYHRRFRPKTDWTLRIVGSNGARDSSRRSCPRAGLTPSYCTPRRRKPWRGKGCNNHDRYRRRRPDGQHPRPPRQSRPRRLARGDRGR